MLKKTIKYTDYFDNERTEDFYFNLTKAELIEMQVGVAGGLEAKLNKIVNEVDTPKIAAFFKELVLQAYGEKSEDGRKFVKSKELSTGFAQTEAYVELVVELYTNPEAASAFVNGIIPQEFSNKLVTPQDHKKPE